MIHLARFLVLQAFHRQGETLARPERGCTRTFKSLVFFPCKYHGLELPRLRAISITNNVGPTKLGRVM